MVTKGLRNQTSSISINFPSKESERPPLIRLLNVIPNRAKVVRNELFGIDFSVNGEEDIEKFITRTWMLNDQRLSKNLTQNMKKDPTSSNSLSLDLSSLNEGSDYNLTFLVTDLRNGQNSSYSYIFSIVRSPQSCPCTILPSEGYPLETDFKFYCPNCQNEEKSLQFVFGFIDDKSGANIPLFSLGEEFSTKLPSPYYTNSPYIRVFLSVVDTSTGASLWKYFNIRMKYYQYNTMNALTLKYKEWMTIANKIPATDTAKNVYNSATVTRTYNKYLELVKNSRRTINAAKSICIHGTFDSKLDKCICENGYKKLDCSLTEEEFETTVKTKDSLVSAFMSTFVNRNPLEIMKDSYLTVTAFGLDALLETYDELSESTFINCFKMVRELITLSNSNIKLKPQQGVEILLRGILNSLYKYIELNNHWQYYPTIITLMKDVGKLYLRIQLTGQNDYQLQSLFSTLIGNNVYKNDLSALIISSSNNNDNQIILPTSMSKYLTDKSIRKPLSFFFMLTNKFGNITFDLKEKKIESKTISVGSNSTILTRLVISTAHMFSNIISSFEILNTNLTNLDNTISYKLTISAPYSTSNMTENSLIESQSTSNSTHSITTKTYQRSQFSCATLTEGFNILLLNDSSCTLGIELDAMKCKCTKQTSVFIAKQIITTWEQIETPKSSPALPPTPPMNSFDMNILIAIVVGIAGSTFMVLGCILLMVGCCKFVLSRRNRKSTKPHTPTQDEELITVDVRFSTV